MARKKLRPNYISIILWILSMIVLSLLTFEIYKANVLPSKFFIYIGGVFLFMIIMFLLFIKNKKTKRPILIILDLLFIIMIGGCYFGYSKLNDLMNFLENNLGAKYETNIYYILVNKDSAYKESKDIKGKTIKLVDELNDKETIERSVDKKVDVEFEYVETITDLLPTLQTDKELILLVNSGTYDAMNENDELLQKEVPFGAYTKILETIEIKYREENKATGIDVTTDPFIVYVNGIDTHSGKLPNKSLSDVNILLAINPKTHEILMVHTPRDYYIEIPGKSVKDKLTHTGLIGGYKMSMTAIENIYGIDIKYYVRVNFNAVIKLVDAIGGLTIYNDQNKSFSCWTDRECIFKPGDNNVKGKCALAFARERHAYREGDRHRGENQEQVISKIIEKITSSKVLLTKSSDILKALEGTFQTNLTTDEITSLVKEQLETMEGWTINTYNVSGGDLYTTTYLYPKNEVYVMTPNEDTIKIAKEKLEAFKK